MLSSTFFTLHKNYHSKNLCTRFLHENSPVPYFKLKPGGALAVGETRYTNAILFSSQTNIAVPLGWAKKNKSVKIYSASILCGALLHKEYWNIL